jgi:hypothetical protein
VTTYALLVGIDAYVPPLTPLYGCRNDIAALETYLRARADGELDLQVLLDAEATRDTVVAGFRQHLARAGDGDVVLFAYCGHGSEEPAPAAIADLEPSGRIQTILLHDCGRRVDGKLRRALADKELSLLLAEVAAGGAHVVVILDCCHAGGGTRDPYARPRAWTPRPSEATAAERDVVAALAAERPSSEFLPGSLDHWRAPRPPHVALAACRSDETAKEHRVGDANRGAFSVALLDSLDVLGARTTYRSLLATVRSRVERTADEQRPELFPLEVGGLADGLFLDGSVRPVAPSFTVTKAGPGWEVDAGIVHGLRDPVGPEAFVLACSDDDETAAGMVRVTHVEVGRSVVEPLEWAPADRAYRAAVVSVPLPPAEIQLDPPVEGGPSVAEVAAVHDAVRAAVASSGPGRSPSTAVRIVDDATASPGALRLRVAVPAPGTARIARADGAPVVGDVAEADGPGARLVVSRLEHVAGWELVRALGDHPSPLADLVTLDLFECQPGETRRPADRPPLATDGSCVLTYRRQLDGSWLAPAVFMQLQSHADQDLYVAVLDLTDRFRCHAAVPTIKLGAGRPLALNEGDPLPATLPDGTPVEPGRSVRDWLKVIVSTVDFEATSFTMQQLDAPPPAVNRGVPRSTLDRLAARAVRRDIGAGVDPASSTPVAQWTASTLVLEVRVPAD